MRVGPCACDWCPYKQREKHGRGRMPCESNGRGWRDAATRQAIRDRWQTTWSWGRGLGQTESTMRHLDLRLPVSRNWDHTFLLFQSPSFCSSATTALGKYYCVPGRGNSKCRSLEGRGREQIWERSAPWSECRVKKSFISLEREVGQCGCLQRQ